MEERGQATKGWGIILWEELNPQLVYLNYPPISAPFDVKRVLWYAVHNISHKQQAAWRKTNVSTSFSFWIFFFTLLSLEWTGGAGHVPALLVIFSDLNVPFFKSHICEFSRPYFFSSRKLLTNANIKFQSQIS